MAVNAFQTQIASTRTTVEDLILRLGLKTSSGEITWVPLCSEQWSDLIRDGDEIWLQIRSGGAEVVGLCDPGPLITMEYKRNNSGGYTTMFLPKTYMVSYI